MRIGIDVRYLSHGLVGGVHTYVANLVPALVEQAGGHRIVLYADRKRPFELPELAARAELRLLPWRSPLSSVANDLLMARQMARDEVEVALFPTNYGFGPRGARTVIMLHDEINLLPWAEIVRGHARTAGTIAKMTYLHLLTSTAVRRADLILTASEYSRGQIARVGGLAPERIVVAPHGVPPDAHRVTDPAELEAVRRRHGLERPFVLADALKNPAVLVRAWHRLSPALRRAHQIVFFARRPDLLPIVAEAVEADEARLLVRPSRADLNGLYSQARAFVFPSWIEGFGLPLLEAMTCGAPIVASDRGSIPEVAGEAALLADAEDDTAFARHLELLLGDSAAADRLRARGFARAAEFSWKRTARRSLEQLVGAARPLELVR